MENRDEIFNYTYSAAQQDEVMNIRKKYLPREENKMEQLRRLDRSVTRKAQAASITVGVIGSLILGVGMCCAMVWQGTWFFPGIVIGLAGIAVVALAYPVYNHVAKKERKRVAPEILRLSEELMK